MAIGYAIDECKQIWTQLVSLETKVSSESYLKEFAILAGRLDFAMSYYQLNCLLTDNFHDPDYFARNSKIDSIIEHRPLPLTPTNL